VATRGGTHPTFIEIGTDRPIYVHRRGSNVVNGRYYFDYDVKNTLAHYSAFRRIDVVGLRKQYAAAKATPPAEIEKTSPLSPGVGVTPLPRFFALDASVKVSAADAIAGLNSEGYWPAPLGYNSHPFRRQGAAEVAPGDFSQTYAGDETDTSPFPDEKLVGISTAAYIRNMSALIRALDGARE
jgi:hypothetical protein